MYNRYQLCRENDARFGFTGNKTTAHAYIRECSWWMIWFTCNLVWHIHMYIYFEYSLLLSLESANNDNKRRSTAGRNKLRRFNNIESVIVEEPFTLSMPQETPTSLKLEAGVKEGNLAGDGYYVSATNNSSRYYGLLVSKEALRGCVAATFPVQNPNHSGFESTHEISEGSTRGGDWSGRCELLNRCWCHTVRTCVQTTKD
jgi:hypothetical protein